MVLGMGLKEALGTNSDINKRKKEFSVGWILTIVVILVVLISIYLIYITTNSQTVIVDDWDRIKLKQEKIEQGWRIEVIEAHKAWTKINEGFNLSEVSYLLTNSSAGLVKNIDGKFDDNGTIIFYDNNNDNLMNIGDTFIINNNSDNKVESGYHFIVLSSTERGSIKLE